MKNFSITSLIVFTTFFSSAQPSLIWHFGSTGSTNGAVPYTYKLSNGDMLVYGLNDGGDIDPGVAVDSTGWEFIARYTSTGQKVFSRPIVYNGLGNLGTIYEFAVDEDDNFYLLLSSPGGLYDFDTIPASGE